MWACTSWESGVKKTLVWIAKRLSPSCFMLLPSLEGWNELVLQFAKSRNLPSPLKWVYSICSNCVIYHWRGKSVKKVPYLSPITLLQTFPHKVFRGKVDSQKRLFDEFSVGCCRWIDTAPCCVSVHRKIWIACKKNYTFGGKKIKNMK